MRSCCGDGLLVSSVCGSSASVGTLAGRYGGVALDEFGELTGGTTEQLGLHSVNLGLNGPVAFSRDGESVYFASSTENRIGLLQLSTGMIQNWCTVPGICVALCMDRDDNLLLATQTTLHRCAKESKEVSALAGGGVSGNDATAEAAGFSNIRDITVDSAMNVLVLDQHCIRKVSQGAVVTTVCGNIATAGHVDGRDITARFQSPAGIAYSEQDGSLFVADCGNARIRRVDSDFKVSTCAGDGKHASNDGSGTAASFNKPTSLVSISGWVYILELSRIRCMSPQGRVTTIAGSTSGHADADGQAARFTKLGKICTDRRGLFVVSQLGSPTSLRMFRAAQVSLEKVPPSTITTDLTELLDDDDNTDLTVMAEGKPIYSLKGLLKARSEYFKSMLESSMKEGQSSSI